MTAPEPIDLTPDDVRRRFRALEAEYERRGRRRRLLFTLFMVPLGLALGYLLAQVLR